MKPVKQLLSVIELGGYPDFSTVYKSIGYQVTTETSVRKAIRTVKTLQPEIVVAEFNFQSDFRDRTSSLESLLSAIQWLKRCEVVVFYEKEFSHQLERLKARYPALVTLAFPIEPEILRTVIENLNQTE